MGAENLIDITDKASTCRKCKYSTTITGQLKGIKTEDICCYYAPTKRHSRRLKDGKPVYPANLCDKYEEGQRKAKDVWKEAGQVTFGKKRGRPKKCDIV